MTTNTMRRVRQKQRADRMLPAHSFQDQRLSRFLPAPRPRSRTSDELRQTAVGRLANGLYVPSVAGLTEVWAREIEKMAKKLRPVTEGPVISIVQALNGLSADASIIDATPRPCPYHSDQRCQADCWYRRNE